jgi:hypothetical protein
MRRSVVLVATFLLTAALVSGCGGGAIIPNVLTGRADVNAAGDSGSITTSDWTYSLPTEGVTWTDHQGNVHDGGRPDCLGPGTSTEIRFAAVETRIEGSTWRAVVWISCQ